MKLASLLLAMMMFSSPALATHGAERALRIVERSEPGVGTLRMVVTHVGEPSYQPFHLSLVVRCDGQREEVLIDEPICESRPHDYDPSTTTLTVRASSSKPTRGPAKCNSRWAQPFNLRELCGGDRSQ